MIGKIAYLFGLKITSGFNRGNVRMDSNARASDLFYPRGGFRQIARFFGLDYNCLISRGCQSFIKKKSVYCNITTES